ncbi:MAG: UDP-2,4-diacetamido-2,4,6-trideoxy-beta-L-altropyranose hydrolase [Saprospiraceae bacterium]|nr:UDP-2,4-diacetamido-2,4,6-trideoxy-beta-L-altropyranose hydrolase [Saprospiraceae bacterium]
MIKLAVFRADASPIIGGGHMHRCLILAEELAKLGFMIAFISNEISSFYKSRIENKQFRLYFNEDGSEEDEFLLSTLNKIGDQVQNKILIIDSDIEALQNSLLQVKVRSLRWKLMYFVFHDRQKLDADIILNQNIRAHELEYQIPEQSVRLLGTNFVILDKGFNHIQNKLPEFADKKNILFAFFGSADAKNRSHTILKLILDSELKFEKIILVVAKLNQKLEQIKILAESKPKLIELHIQTDSIHELMSEAKFAFTSGGLSLWELASCKVSQIVVPTSEREQLTLDYCRDHGLVHTIGEPENLSSKAFADIIKKIMANENNEAMVNKFYKLVNTKGVEKVALAINHLF